MTVCYDNLMYATDGSTALAPAAAPRFVMIEGGKRGNQFVESLSSNPEARAASGFSVAQCVAAMLVAAVISISVFAVDAFSSSFELSALEGAETVVVSVRPGDSLWSLASEYGVDGCATDRVVDWIRTQNHLTSSNIYAGQQLIVPSSPNL